MFHFNIFHRLIGRIPLEEIPALFRAVGFYPSEEEITQMINQVHQFTASKTKILFNTSTSRKVRYESFSVNGETKSHINSVSFSLMIV